MGNITLISQSTGSMANINPLRYRGYYYDNETGFCYLQSRYKNPTGKDSWHPDLNHPDKIGPHWDYNDGLGHKWRVYPPNSNRNIELVK